MQKSDYFSTYLYYLSAAAAGYIIDRHKNVKSLSFRIRYYDPRERITSFSNEFTRRPEDSAMFRFRCPVDYCRDGGFDLTELVMRMLEDERVTIKGSMTCTGWHYIEGKEKSTCGSKLEYEIKAVYYDRHETRTFWDILFQRS